MKDFLKGYKEARAKAREYTGAKRAGWAEPVYLTWVLNLQGYMVQLATGEHDAVKCQECGHVFRAGWMEGRCPYCEAQKAATRYVESMREAARE